MTFKFKKLLTYILIILLFISAGLILYILTSYKGDFPQFSAYSTEENGIKALYSLTQKMGFAAERYHYPAMFLEDGIVMVAFRPDLNSTVTNCQPVLHCISSTLPIRATRMLQSPSAYRVTLLNLALRWKFLCKTGIPPWQSARPAIMT